jgi:1-acyl-sn-glycerol-3-phosphate acyltransferase
VINHVNILEIPLMYARLQPRTIRGLALADRWKSPVFAWGLTACGAIPLQRGGVNLTSIRQALDALSAGEILFLAPEGTRSGDGRLQMAHPGVVILAVKSHAPILPIVSHGSEKYKENFKHLRRTDFHITVGKPFRLKAADGAVDSQTRRQMLDELMGQMAALLPPEFRGVYANLPDAAPKYLEFC